MVEYKASKHRNPHQVVANFGGERTVVGFLDFARQALAKLGR